LGCGQICSRRGTCQLLLGCSLGESLLLDNWLGLEQLLSGSLLHGLRRNLLASSLVIPAVFSELVPVACFSGGRNVGFESRLLLELLLRETLNWSSLGLVDWLLGGHAC